MQVAHRSAPCFRLLLDLPWSIDKASALLLLVGQGEQCGERVQHCGQPLSQFAIAHYTVCCAPLSCPAEFQVVQRSLLGAIRSSSHAHDIALMDGHPADRTPSR